MKNKSKNFNFVIRILIVIGVLILVALFFLFPKTKKEIRMFEDEFGLSLPKETNVIFSESDYGAMGDGHLLYIFQLTASEMKPLITYKKIGSWYPLPIDIEMAQGLHDTIKGVHPKMANNIDFNIKKGYYIIKNSTHNRPLFKYNFYDESYNNVIIGMIDTQKNLIYFCTWDT